MKKVNLFFIAICTLGFINSMQARSSLSSLNKMYVGSKKTIRGCKDLQVDPDNIDKVYITEKGENKHKVTARKPGVIMFTCTKEDGTSEEQTVTIQEMPESQTNVSFGVGYYPYSRYYISSDPLYDTYWGWGNGYGWGGGWWGHHHGWRGGRHHGGHRR